MHQNTAHQVEEHNQHWDRVHQVEAHNRQLTASVDMHHTLRVEQTLLGHRKVEEVDNWDYVAPAHPQVDIASYVALALRLDERG